MGSGVTAFLVGLAGAGEGWGPGMTDFLLSLSSTLLPMPCLLYSFETYFTSINFTCAHLITATSSRTSAATGQF